MKRALIAAAVLLATTASGQSVIPNSPGTRGTWAIRNATIHPVTSAPISGGTIVISGGKITAVGASVTIPEGATVIDGTGLSVYPGLIDAGTTIGLTEISSVAGTNDSSETGDFNPNAMAKVAVNPHTNVIPVTRINGITTVITEPRGGIIAGQDALINLAGWTIEEMLIKAPVAMHINFPRLRSASSPDATPDEEKDKEADKSYESSLDRLKTILREADAYGRARDAQKTGSPRVDEDPRLRNLVPVVRGEIPVVIHADMAADIRAAIAFATEMKLKMILAGADDVQRVIGELKGKNIPVLVGPAYSLPPRSDDPYDLVFSNAAALFQAGIPFAMQSMDAHDVRNLPYQAAAAAAYGLPREEALKAVTIYPARILGVDSLIGSLEVGKIANVILTNGDPLQIRTQVKRVFINGEDISMESYHTLQYEKFRARPAATRK